MKKLKYILMFLFLVAFSSCTTEKRLFEMEIWWNGHWQNIEEPSSFFSVGQKPVGAGGIITAQFFISTSDSIYSNFYLTSLDGFNHRKKFKLIKTSEGTYLKIQEINEQNIEVYGPSNSITEMELNKHEYRMIPDNIDPPFPDSILFVN